MGRKYKFCESPLPGESLLCYYITLGDKVVFEHWLDGEDMGMGDNGYPLIHTMFSVEKQGENGETSDNIHWFNQKTLTDEKREFHERMGRQERLAAYATAAEKGEEIPYREDCNLLDQRTVEFLMKMRDYPEFVSAIEMAE